MTTHTRLRVVQAGDRPPPLMPPEIDLGELPDALIDIAWACDSRFSRKASDEEWRAAVRLLLRSQHERPAATLPDDDDELAYLAGCRDPQRWLSIKGQALGDWVLCSDGRYHHQGMAAKALDIWIKKLATRRKSAAGVAKRKKIEFNSEPFDRPIQTAVDALYLLNPQAPVLRHYMNVTTDIEPIEEDEAATPGSTSGQTPGSTSGQTPGSTSGQTPGSTKGKERNRIESEGYISPAASAAGAIRPDLDSGGAVAAAKPAGQREKVPILPWPLDGFERFWAVYPRKVDKEAALAAFTELIADPPLPFDDLLAAVTRYRDRKPACNDTAYPATWLRRRRWTDEWPEPPPDKPRFLNNRRPWQPSRLQPR